MQSNISLTAIMAALLLYVAMPASICADDNDNWSGEFISVNAPDREGYSLAVYDNLLHLGGFFINVASFPRSHIAAYDGANWTEVGDGTNDVIWDLLV